MKRKKKQRWFNEVFFPWFETHGESMVQTEAIKTGSSMIKKFVDKGKKFVKNMERGIMKQVMCACLYLCFVCPLCICVCVCVCVCNFQQCALILCKQKDVFFVF